MILQVLSIFLCCGTLAQALYEGDPCRMPNGRNGVCASLENCASVRQQLLDDMPVSTCTQYPLTVCCPRLARHASKHLRSLPKWDKKPTVFGASKHLRSFPKSDKKPTVFGASKHLRSLPKWDKKPTAIEVSKHLRSLPKWDKKPTVSGGSMHLRSFPKSDKKPTVFEASKHLRSLPKWDKKPTVTEGPTYSRSVPEWSEKPAVIQGPGRGQIARQKCAEYSEYVYTWMYAPPPFQDQKKRRNECATRGGIKLIVEGTKAEPKEFPHMAAIGYDLEDGTIGWKCGGTIISERFILTAAHCTWSSEWGNATWVRLGDLNLVRTDDIAEPVDIRVAERINHPKYRGPAVYHDIALLRLETAIKFNGWMRPACLHTEPTPGTPHAVATGWGNVRFFDQSKYDLQKVTLPIVNIETCKKEWEHTSNTLKVPDGVKDEWSICAGGDGGDTCLGDSGGPLVVSSKTKYCMHDIVGVTSLGQFCGFKVPGIYTRVYHYVPWIESKVWGTG